MEALTEKQCLLDTLEKRTSKTQECVKTLYYSDYKQTKSLRLSAGFFYLNAYKRRNTLLNFTARFGHVCLYTLPCGLFVCLVLLASTRSNRLIHNYIKCCLVYVPLSKHSKVRNLQSACAFKYTGLTNYIAFLF